MFKISYSMYMMLISCMFFCVSCTYSINMVHTQGQASDVVDENQSADPDISPDISLPVKGI